MKTFYDFLNEIFITANTFYISDKKEKESLNITKYDNIVLKYEKHKIKTKIFDILDTYETKLNQRIWNVKIVAFLIYKIDNDIHVFSFDGDILHQDMAYFLDNKKYVKSINYKTLYDDFKNIEILKNLDLEKNNWCLPVRLYKDQYIINDEKLNILLDKNINSFFDISKDEFKSKFTNDDDLYFH
jgi:hypothetical protein